jgi:hypothetical protein
MKYSIEIGLGVMMHMSSFIKINSDKILYVGDSQTHRQQCALISLLQFFFSK